MPFDYKTRCVLLSIILFPIVEYARIKLYKLHRCSVGSSSEETLQGFRKTRRSKKFTVFAGKTPVREIKDWCRKKHIVGSILLKGNSGITLKCSLEFIYLNFLYVL